MTRSDKAHQQEGRTHVCGLPGCKRKFKTRLSLAIHRRDNHGETVPLDMLQPVTCAKCGRVSKDAYAHEQHMGDAHEGREHALPKNRRDAHVPQNVPCPYCGKTCALVEGGDIYRVWDRPYSHKRFYQCKPCNAHVGVHPGTLIPLGPPADRGTRQARTSAHAAFDWIWHSGRMSRKGAYSWLRERLGLTVDECHIGHMDPEQCERVKAVCLQYRKDAGL